MAQTPLIKALFIERRLPLRYWSKINFFLKKTLGYTIYRKGFSFFKQDFDNYHDLMCLDDIWKRKVYALSKIDNDSVVIDLGANIGAFTCYVASDAKKVYCYEPDPRNFKLIKRNISLNGFKNVSAHCLAVWSKSCKQTLFVNSSATSSNSMIQKDNKDSSVEIDCITLKQIFDKNNILNCNLIKIDTEGAEYEILENFPYFDKIETMFIEFHNGIQFLDELLIKNKFKTIVTYDSENVGYIVAFKDEKKYNNYVFNELCKKGTPLFKSLFFERRMPYRYRQETLMTYKKYNYLNLMLFLPFIFNKIKNILKIHDKNKKTIVFKLDSYLWRYLYPLLRNFKDYNIIFVKKMNLRNFIDLGIFRNLVFSIKSLKFVDSIPKNKNFVVVHEKTLPHYKEFNKEIKLDLNILDFNSKNSDHAYIPFCMYPEVYKFTKNLNKLRNQKRNIKLFFSGNFNDEDHSIFMKRHNKLSRLKIVEVVSSLNKTHILSELKDLKKSFNNKILINDFSKNKIKSKDWLKTLSRCDFFLCAPGAFMPVCRNLIESMSVGTIPILNYADWLHPNLKDGENCLIFNDENELLEKINNIFKMDSNKINQMRINVIKYYEEYLTSKYFIKSLELEDNKSKTIFMTNSFIFNPKCKEYIK